MNFSKTFIDRPIATALIMAALLLSGGLAFTQLPVASLPSVDFPTISVSAALPGADAETMASSVATPLERQFAQIPSLTQMTSTSSLGNTSINLQFDLSRNIDAAAQDVSAAINAAGGQLPKNLPSPPVYHKTNPADQPILIIGVYSSVMPLDQVDDYADNILSQQISQIPGIGQVFHSTASRSPRSGCRSTRPPSPTRASRWKTSARSSGKRASMQPKGGFPRDRSRPPPSPPTTRY